MYRVDKQLNDDNMAYEQTSTREEALIPNTLIETMFLRIATDTEMAQYVKLVDDGHVSLATAYASVRVNKLWNALIEIYERQGGDVDLLRELMKGKKK